MDSARNTCGTICNKIRKLSIKPSQKQYTDERIILDLRIVATLLRALPNQKFIFTCPDCGTCIPEQLKNEPSGISFNSTQDFIQYASTLTCCKCDTHYWGISNWSALGLKLKDDV